MRQRLRELGYAVGRFDAGARNSFVDVPGVRVGHCTLAELHTGVTAVLPHGDNPYAEKVLAACHVVNGYGKAAGLSQLGELGTLESPILLTSTVSVGPVWEGGLRWLLELNPEAAVDRDTINVVVGECFDGWLGDSRGLNVRPEHALEAIAAAREDEVTEGVVGAGTGTTCFGFKSGVGCSSRLAGGATLGSLVVTNYGARREAHLLLGADAPPAPDAPGQGGSAIVVLATDAPLSERQLRRLAARGGLGLGRAGSFAANASGEYALAFSTAQRVPHRRDDPFDEFRFLRDDSRAMARAGVRGRGVRWELAVESPTARSRPRRCGTRSARPRRSTGRAGHRADALPTTSYPALPVCAGPSRASGEGGPGELLDVGDAEVLADLGPTTWLPSDFWTCASWGAVRVGLDAEDLPAGRLSSAAFLTLSAVSPLGASRPDRAPRAACPAAAGRLRCGVLVPEPLSAAAPATAAAPMATAASTATPANTFCACLTSKPSFGALVDVLNPRRLD